MTRALARKYACRVSPYVSGTLASAVTAWTPFNGIVDFNDAVKATMQDATDYDNNGYAGTEKTLETWSATVKATRPFNAGAYDPGQEIVRATRLAFGDQARVFVQWYDRNGGTDAYAGVALPDWTQSKTAVADLEEVQVVFNGDGQLYNIANPYQTPNIPTVQAVSPAAAGTGTAVAITGSYFTGTVVSTGVKFGGTAATSFSVISDGLIVAVLPSGTAGSAAVTVTNANGTSASFAYTRAA
jgi:hypothetical protein